MAHIPKINTTGITDAEGMIGNLYNYIYGLPQTMSTPPIGMSGLPSTLGLTKMMQSMRRAPMTALAGGGVSDPASDDRYQSALRLEGNPARAQIGMERSLAKQGIMGQNLQLGENDLTNNLAMMSMIQNLLGGSAGALATLGTYPPGLRGLAQSTAASGTGVGGGGLLGMFGL